MGLAEDPLILTRRILGDLCKQIIQRNLNAGMKKKVSDRHAEEASRL